jgi:hypothetical protein
LDTSKLKAYCDALLQQLSTHGWQRVAVEFPFEKEWWAAEIWTVESIWSPVGIRAYLTFLVDPQGTDVWALGAACERPQDRFAAAELFCLPGPGRGWQTQMPALFKVLAMFRNEVRQEREPKNHS